MGYTPRPFRPAPVAARPGRGAGRGGGCRPEGRDREPTQQNAGTQQMLKKTEKNVAKLQELGLGLRTGEEI